MSPLASEAVLRPLEVPDDVISVGGASSARLSGVDGAHVHCPSSHMLSRLYDDSTHTHTDRNLSLSEGQEIKVIHDFEKSTHRTL